MPRRKISIEEAFAALDAAGIKVQVKAAEPVVAEPKGDSDPLGIVKKQPKIGESTRTTVQHGMVKIPLYARHSIAAGGDMVASADGKQVVGSGTESYGPGLVFVPVQYAQSLLHADMLARQADDNLLDKTKKEYLAVEMQDSSGNRVFRGLRVPEGTLDNIGNLPDRYMIKLR